MDVAQTAVTRLPWIEVPERLMSFDTTIRVCNLGSIGFVRDYLDGLEPGRPTVTVEGGTRIVPNRAAFTMEWRFIPGGLPYRHLDSMQTCFADTIGSAIRAVHPDDGGGVTCGRSMAVPQDHAPATQVAGAIVCVPGHIAHAPRPEEWIAVAQLEACDCFMRCLADRLLV